MGSGDLVKSEGYMQTVLYKCNFLKKETVLSCIFKEIPNYLLTHTQRKKKYSDDIILTMTH